MFVLYDEVLKQQKTAMGGFLLETNALAIVVVILIRIAVIGTVVGG